MPVHAEIQREYSVQEAGYAFKVTVLVQTEQDNTWLKDGTYEIHFSMEITNISSMYYPSGFIELHFRSDPLKIYGSQESTITSEQFVTPDSHSSPLLYQVTFSKYTGQIDFYPKLTWSIYDYEQQQEIEGGSWEADFPIYINVVSPSEGFSPMLYLAIGVCIGLVIAIVPSAVYLLRKKRLKNSPQP